MAEVFKVIQVKMSDREYARAVKEGNKRRGTSVREGRSDTLAVTMDKNATDIDAAAAEFAVAIWGGYPWTGEGNTGALDAGPYEVKWTDTSEEPRRRLSLLVQKKNIRGHPGQKFMLVTGTGGLYAIHGYAFEREVRERWNTRYKRPCYSVPRSELHTPVRWV